MKTPWAKRKQRLRILKRIEERKKKIREKSNIILNENLNRKRKQLQYTPVNDGSFLNEENQIKNREYVRREFILSKRQKKVEAMSLGTKLKKTAEKTASFAKRTWDHKIPLIGIATLGVMFGIGAYIKKNTNSWNPIDRDYYMESLLKDYDGKENFIAMKPFLQKELTPAFINEIRKKRKVKLTEDMPFDNVGEYIPLGRRISLQLLVKDPNLGIIGSDGTSKSKIYAYLNGKRIYINENRGGGKNSNRVFVDIPNIKIDKSGKNILYAEITNGDGINDEYTLEFRCKPNPNTPHSQNPSKLEQKTQTPEIQPTNSEKDIGPSSYSPTETKTPTFNQETAKQLYAQFRNSGLRYESTPKSA